MHRWWPLLLVATASMLAGSCTSNAHVVVTPVHSDDRVEWLSRSPPALRIDCSKGIGAATVTTTASWPESLDVELTLAALEGFTVRSGNEIHRLAISTTGQILVEPDGSDVLHMNSFRPIETGPNVRLSLQLGNLAEPADSVRIEWVDFYR